MGRRKLFEIDTIWMAAERWFLEHGHAPTIKEFAEELGGVSTRTAFRYLRELEKRGLIERRPGARAWRLLPVAMGLPETIASVPLLGEAPAGPLLLAEENMEAHVGLPKEWLIPSAAEHYLLTVRGNSMNRAAVNGVTIQSGDLVLVRQQATAEPGAVVVALVDGEVTIKRLIKGHRYWILKPESDDPRHTPIILTEDFRIQGEVRRVLKGATEHLQEWRGRRTTSNGSK